jgi:hypothetical protein
MSLRWCCSRWWKGRGEFEVVMELWLQIGRWVIAWLKACRFGEWLIVMEWVGWDLKARVWLVCEFEFWQTQVWVWEMVVMARKNCWSHGCTVWWVCEWGAWMLTVICGIAGAKKREFVEEGPVCGLMWWGREGRGLVSLKWWCGHALVMDWLQRSCCQPSLKEKRKWRG